MKILNLVQGSNEWLSYRKTRITGTDMSKILNLNPYQNAYDLWRQKKGLIPPPQINAAMKRGMDCEDDARTLFIQETETYVHPQVIASDEHPWLIASLDGLCDYNSCFVEIKTPLERNFDTAQINTIPRHYEIQMQTAFAASDGVIPEGYYCLYSPEKDKIHYRKVFPDRKLIETIIRESKEFYRRLTENDCPPPPHLVLETPQMEMAVNEYIIADDMEKRAKELKQKAREKLLILSRGHSVKGFGLKLTRYFSRGGVNYKNIPELKNVDLEKYRGPPRESTRITYV